MKTLLRSVTFALIAGAVAAIPSIGAETKSPAFATPVEEGFTSLFNGKDLTGWNYGVPVKKTKTGKEVPSNSGKGYQVSEDGVLYCTVEDGGNLYTDKEYANFIYRFEFRLTENANNGIGIRTPTGADPAYQGMEIQVLDDSGSKYTKLRPEQYHGSVYDVFPAKRGSLKPVGEWNSEEIMADGSRIKVTVNGQVIVDTDLSEIKDEAVLAKHPGLKNKKGYIAFLGHGAKVEFRGMRIKELPEKQ